MDRRKYQRVALFAGLLFLLAAAEGLLAYRLVQAEKNQQQIMLGNQVTANPELESELVKSFYGKDEAGEDLTAEQRETYGQKGAELAGKYGYASEKYSSAKEYLYGMGAVLLLGMAGFAGFFITERRQLSKVQMETQRQRQQQDELEVRFEKVTKKLAREEQETKALITDISHQLKTPIASLKMGYEIAQTTALTEAEKQGFEQKGYEEMQRLERLLESLLNLSKLEAKLIQLQPAPCSLKEILTQAVNSVYMKAFDKNIDISMEKFPDTTLVLDAKWTQEAFANLLDNAVKYSPEHTEIQMRVSTLTSYMLIEVVDQGIGIRPEEANSVFKRFYRGNDQLVNGQEGSGVGLYLTRKIVEEQGGTVSVKAGYPTGSIFRVTLPLRNI
ncbi:MAG: HAMP domain-containing sensor histidine kinase [Lachnospiraceae bacterium]|nr:HAMP domain-containing sensor histidine kinase [Lachnospiraceae bacterium]